MTDMPAFDGLIIVVAVAFAAPFVLGLFPSVRLPSIVLEIIAGIVIGPSILGWVEVDQSIEVISLIGLAFLVFLAGLEIEFPKLRGDVLSLTWLPFIVAATAIGEELGLVTAAEGAALIGAGLLSVLLFPVTGLALLRGVDAEASRL